MTYSGLLMLVIGVAIARVIFGKSDRTWAALVLPALGVAVALTFTRSAWVGGCAAVALLFSLKDFRLFALLPILAAIFIAVAPGQITRRYQSMFNMNDPTVRDRYTMLRIGERMVRAHPLTGVGPNMVQRLYVGYKGSDTLVGPDGVTHINPHLHNDFLQIAAERGLPALALWLWFIVALMRDLWKRFQAGQRELAATAMAIVVALLTAGLFEYNFGDSEVLMLFLTIVTLPAAAARPPS
jgi:O-antigen ligase